jgi:hypothetical protein
MDHSISDALLNLFIITGYAGIVIAMAIESCCIPLPSELIMPLAGFLAFQGASTSERQPLLARLVASWALPSRTGLAPSAGAPALAVRPLRADLAPGRQSR